MTRGLLSALGWLATILAVSIAVSLGALSIRSSVSAPWRRGPLVEVVSAGATSPSSPAPMPDPEPIDRYPSARVAYDSVRPNRLYAGGAVSEDGGRTWRTLAGSDGQCVRLLGGQQALPPVPGPGGRLLVGGVLFEQPGVALGLGPVAAAAEWRGEGWARFGSTSSEADLAEARSERRARAIGYMPDGTAVVVTARAVATFDGRSWPTPGRLVNALLSSTGAIYAGIDESGRFPLYRADTLGAGWLPVAGVGRVDALTETEGTVLALSGAQVGRLERGQWNWAGLPASFRPRYLAAHPRGPLVALWGRDRLIVSSDGGRHFRDVPIGYELEWVAWDPFAPDMLTVLERGGGAHRLSTATIQ